MKLKFNLKCLKYMQLLWSWLYFMYFRFEFTFKIWSSGKWPRTLLKSSNSFLNSTIFSFFLKSALCKDLLYIDALKLASQTSLHQKNCKEVQQFQNVKLEILSAAVMAAILQLEGHRLRDFLIISLSNISWIFWPPQILLQITLISLRNRIV